MKLSCSRSVGARVVRFGRWSAVAFVSSSCAWFVACSPVPAEPADADDPKDTGAPFDAADAHDTNADVARDGGADANAEAGDAAPDSSADVGTDGGGVRTCASPCAPDQKYCNQTCVPVDAPAFGCNPSGCAPCPTSFRHATVGCSAGACVIGACAPGWLDCNGSSADGCEVDANSASNCGACGNSCGAGVCAAGVCVSACAFPQTNCGGSCRSLGSDPWSCGTCLHECPPDGASAVCSGGVCAVPSSCPAGQERCGSTCVDTHGTDTSNCGACGAVCPPYGALAPACNGGVCAPPCRAAGTYCAGACVMLESDAANCGVCGKVCLSGELCVAGACVAATTTTILDGLAGPADLAVDATHVYWVDSVDSSVRKVPKGGGAAVVLATGQAKPVRIALDDDFVYWTSQLGGAVLRIDKGGVGPFQVVASAVSPTDLVVDATDVYFLEGGSIRRAPKSGGTATTFLGPDSHMGWVAIAGLDETKICGLFGIGVMQASLFDKGGVFRGGASHVAHDAVSFAGSAIHFRRYGTAPYYEQLSMFHVATGAEQELVSWGASSPTGRSTLFDPRPLAIDDCTALLADSGQIAKLDVRARRVVGLAGTSSTPARVVADDSFAYWIEPTSLHRVAR